MYKMNKNRSQYWEWKYYIFYKAFISLDARKIRDITQNGILRLKRTVSWFKKPLFLL